MDSTIGVSAKRYRYTGKERDEETGLDSMGVRYYAAWLGRWTSSDPIGIGDGVNRFAYVSGNPVGMRDPSGMATNEAAELQQIRAEAEIARQEAIYEAERRVQDAEQAYAVAGIRLAEAVGSGDQGEVTAAATALKLRGLDVQAAKEEVAFAYMEGYLHSDYTYNPRRAAVAEMGADAEVVAEVQAAQAGKFDAGAFQFQNTAEAVGDAAGFVAEQLPVVGDALAVKDAVDLAFAGDIPGAVVVGAVGC